MGHRDVRSTTPQPQPTWPRGHRHPHAPRGPRRSSLRTVSLCLSLASPRFAGAAESFSRCRLRKVAPSSPSHPSPASSPSILVCSNRTRGSPGCAHLTSGVGVATQGSAPSSAQRAARSALRQREHPVLAVPNGLFQQLGPRADLPARRNTRVLQLQRVFDLESGLRFLVDSFDETC